ncbi:hypothetical protein B0H17DRAFT_1091308 [Mycena rosella]|uniref:F-box domain-containing protein n=1 Tax=Mycena rosella TaxID=1033263 RepID=A0AAD7CYW9_MYCRO|nr:hypothetical protein B0H17DRAFT_1091308 [Mycena rosella]
MSLLHHERLPTELWLEIFTHLDGRTSAYSTWHTPFQPTPCVASEGNVGSAYTSVVLVCRNWRAWAIGLLYRNIKLLDGIRLKDGIDVPREYGRWVRRAVVPYSTTVTETCRPMSSTEILGLCPNLEVIVRPPYGTPLSSLRFDFDASCPSSLGSLKRLDWWHHWEASRSGGINSLTSVLGAAPNLEYLFVGGVPYGPPFHGLIEHIYLPNLRTLRLSINNAMLLRHIVQRWALPALNALVLDSPIVGVMDMIWEALGPQLEFIEFGRHLRFFLHQVLTPCLQGCPSLREINYYVFMTAPPEMAPGAIYPSVTAVGINMTENAFLGDAQHEWEHLERHFDALTGEMFPNLRRFRVFTIMERMLTDERFSLVRQRLRDRGCIVEFPEA